MNFSEIKTIVSSVLVNVFKSNPQLKHALFVTCDENNYHVLYKKDETYLHSGIAFSKSLSKLEMISFLKGFDADYKKDQMYRVTYTFGAYEGDLHEYIRDKSESSVRQSLESISKRLEKEAEFENLCKDAMLEDGIDIKEVERMYNYETNPSKKLTWLNSVKESFITNNYATIHKDNMISLYLVPIDVN